MARTSTADVMGQSRGRGRPKKKLLGYEIWADAIEARALARETLSWPSTKYQHDPVGFCRDILGYDPWARQVDLMCSVRDHTRTAVCSGQKTSKTRTIASLALWWFCRTPVPLDNGESGTAAQVIITSTTDRQVNIVIWSELQQLKLNAGICLECRRAKKTSVRPCPHSALIPGDLPTIARTGFKAPDGRLIIGFTAREPEAVQGISGSNNLYLIDEASGVDDLIFEAIRGNCSGGGKMMLVSNPTRNDGFFFRSFHEASSNYSTLKISSYESPNVVAGKVVIPGLATLESINELITEYGKDSALFKVRVLGEFVTYEASSAFSLGRLIDSENGNETANDIGRLQVGLDPAGSSGLGDDSAFSAVRDKKHVALELYTGLDAQGHLATLLSFLKRHSLGATERPVVVLDRDGSIGAELYGLLRNYEQDNPNAFRLVGVRAGERSFNPIYHLRRDELTGNLDEWLKEGGAIKSDVKLQREFLTMRWSQSKSGKLSITPKDVIRKELGRSCDRFDSLALAVWCPNFIREESGEPISVGEQAAPPTIPEAYDAVTRGGAFDVYRQLGQMNRRR